MKYRLFCLVFALSLLTPSVLILAHEMHGWKAPEKAKKMKSPIRVTGESLRKAKQIYEQKCAMCHGANGDGQGPAAAGLNPKPTNFREHRKTEVTDGELFWKIRTGRGAMPSYKADLSEVEVWHLIGYIRTFETQ